MTAMTKSSPFLLLLATIFLLLVALAAFWITLMPQRMLGQLAETMAREQGVSLEALRSRLNFDGGLTLQLEAVTLADANSAASLSARDLSLDIGFSALFGGAVIANTLTLTAPVLTLDVSKRAKALKLPARHILFREGRVKLWDSQRKSGVGFDDVNGSITADDSAKLEISFVQNGSLKTMVAEADSAERLLSDGSPVDIIFSSQSNILSFSGRARLRGGLALDGQTTFESKDTGDALRWMGVALKRLDGAGAIAVTAGVSVDGLSATFKDVSIKVGATEFKGLANLQAGPDRMKVTGDLVVTTLALLSSENILVTPWSELPFNLADLTAVDTDLKLKIGRLSLRGQELGAADMALAMDGGNTVAELSLATAQMNMQLTPHTNSLELKAGIEAKNADMKGLLGGLVGFADVSGPVDLNADVSATGLSPAAWVSTVKGHVAFQTRRASLNGIDIPALLASPQEGWKYSPSAATTGFSASVDAELREGVAILKKVDMSLAGSTVSAKGEIDLLRQAFDVTLSPKRNVQSIKGRWVQPLFTADAGAAPPLRPASVPAN
jgi:uncharacterized protein involved in outer membrane biogenesis